MNKFLIVLFSIMLGTLFAMKCHAADAVFTITIPDAKRARVYNMYKSKYMQNAGENNVDFVKRCMILDLKYDLFSFETANEDLRYRTVVTTTTASVPKIEIVVDDNVAQ